MNVKVMIADVDDTICESTKVIKKDMIKAIVRLAESGTKIVFISGSTVDQIYWQISPFIRVDHYLVGTSGSAAEFVSKEGVRTKLFKKEFSKDQRNKVLEAFEDLIVCHLVYPMTTKEDQLQDRGTQITFSCLGRNAPKEAKKLFDPDKIIRSRWVRFIKDRLGDKHLEYSINMGGTTSIDVTLAGIDKASGIRDVLAIIKESPENCIFLGDNIDPGGNDYPATIVIKRFHKVKSLEDSVEILNQILKDKTND